MFVVTRFVKTNSTIFKKVNHFFNKNTALLKNFSWWNSTYNHNKMYRKLYNHVYIPFYNPNLINIFALANIRKLTSVPSNNGNPDSGSDEEKKPRPRSLPRLMLFPEILWPSVLKSIKNWIMVQFIIRPYFDNDFNLRDFIFGSKHALQVISYKLSRNDLNSLGSLVSDKAINELKPVLQKMSISEQTQLEIKKEDIYLTFPYQVGIMFDDTNQKTQKRWVEITMVFHVMRGLKDMRESGQEIPWNLGTLPEYQDKVFICNYRFIKEFTQGNESDWIVNVINHFKPIDLLTE